MLLDHIEDRLGQTQLRTGVKLTIEFENIGLDRRISEIGVGAGAVTLKEFAYFQAILRIEEDHFGRNPHRVGIAPHAREEGRIRRTRAEAAVRLTGRVVFMATAAALMTLLLFVAVVRPAIDRGGLGEFLGIAALFVAILLGERWLRSR